MSQPTNENYLQRAEKLMEINRFREAIPVLTQALTQNPQNYQVICSISYCFSQLEENDKSLQYAEKAIAVDPEAEWGYRLKSIVYGRRRDRSNALEFARKAVSLDPENEFALSNFVHVLLYAEKLQEDRMTAEKILEMSPDSAQSHYLLGLVEKAYQNYPDAEKCFRQALEIAPHYAEARNSLATSMLKQTPRTYEDKNDGVENQALEHLIDSLKLDPNNQILIDNVKKQFDNTLLYFGMIYFLPIFFVGLIVTPIVTILFSMFVWGVFILLIRQNNRRYEKLSPETKNLLKIRNYRQYIKEQFFLFLFAGVELFKVVWIQYLAAVVILAAYLSILIFSFQGNISYFLKLLFWVNLIWLSRQIAKFGEPAKS